jgi:dihydroxyacid dehydratase/phosphogluconate dehydratase
MGVELSLDDWQRIGEDVPLLVNCMPAGKYLGEGFHRAGGVPAVMHELQKAGKLHEDCASVIRQDHWRNRAQCRCPGMPT